MHRSFVALLNTAVYRLAVLTVTYNISQRAQGTLLGVVHTFVQLTY